MFVGKAKRSSPKTKLEASVEEYCAKFLSVHAAKILQDNLGIAKGRMNRNDGFFANMPHSRLSQGNESKDLFKYSLKQTLGNVIQLMERAWWRKF